MNSHLCRWSGRVLILATFALTACDTHPTDTTASSANASPVAVTANTQTPSPLTPSLPAAMPAEIVTANGKGSLDVFDVASNPAPGHVEHLQLAPGRLLLVEGWAYDVTAAAPGSAVIVIVDGKHAYGAQYGIERPDVSAYFKDDTYFKTGYRAALPAAAFGAGSHTILIALRSADGKRYIRIVGSRLLRTN